MRLTGRLNAIRRSTGRYFLRAESLVIAALVLCLLVLYPTVRDRGLLQVIEGHTLDWRFQLRGPQAPTPEIVIVAVDERTLAETGRWPFSREWLARTVDQLDAAGARTIVFDLLLTGSERRGLQPFFESPALFLRETRGERVTPSSDQALAYAIQRAGNVVVPYAFSFDPNTLNATELPPSARASAFRLVLEEGQTGNKQEPEADGMLLPQMPFLAAGYPAHVTVFLEPDGKVRFAHPAIRFGDDYYPSIAIEAARLYLGLDRDEVALRIGDSVNLGSRRLALDGSTSMALNYAGAAGIFPTHSLADVATGKVRAGAFHGKVVLIGATATALGDRFLSPFSLRVPGVELVATMLDNVLASRPLVRGARVEGWDMAAIIVVGLIGLGLPQLQRAAAIGLAAVGLLSAWAVFASYVFTAQAIWLNATFPAVLIILSAVIAIMGRTVRESRLRTQAERQQQTLAHYVSPLTSAGLARAGAIRGDGETTPAAVMFVDLVGYTQTSERLAEPRSAAMLRNFHELIESQAARFGGTIDKFMGDGAMVVFGVPGGRDTDAANAIACARGLVEALRHRNETEPKADPPSIQCGIGIHFGPVMLTELGGHMHRQITVTGDTVNVASRLEAMTREWGAVIIVSEAVLEAARAAGADEQTLGFEPLPVDHVRGRSAPLKLWAWGMTEPVKPAKA